MSQTTILQPPTLHLNLHPVIDLSIPPPLQPSQKPPTPPPPPPPWPTPLAFPTRPSPSPRAAHVLYPPTKPSKEADDDFPAGFPYDGWSGFWIFAVEFVRGMQGLLMQWLEGTGRYGWVRHTT